MPGYAVRTDGVYGVRAVDGPESCMAHETYSEVFVERTDTLEDQLAAIEAEHAAGEELLNKRILGVMLADGQSQAAKTAALQAAYMTLANETDAKLRALLPPTEGE